MNHFFRSKDDTFPGVYRSALVELSGKGIEVRPRGMLTKEISPATFAVDPLTSLLVSPKRNLNFGFLFAENLWYLAGRSDTHFISYYNSNIKNFSEDGLHDGAYGPRIVSQLRYVIDTLNSDPDSRQAIISLWTPNPRPSKDIPCTSLFQFMIRDGKLNCYVTMRSNDIIWGTGYDAPSFALIQMVVASCLDLPVGMLYLTANSLHLYEAHFDLANELILEDPYPVIKMDPFPSMTLENHILQWHLLLVFEGALRMGIANDVVMLEYANAKLDQAYFNYLLVFCWVIHKKNKDQVGMTFVSNWMSKEKFCLSEWFSSKS